MIGASFAPPLIAATAAPAVAIAFWRTGLGALAVAPFAVRARAEIGRADQPALGLAVLAGALLAAHFAALQSSLRLTSVASAAGLASSQAMWAGVFSALLGERRAPRAWAGTGVAILGVLVVTGVDVSVSARALAGDALALLGGVLGGAYIVAGGQVRRELSTTAYTSICYSAAALLLLAFCLLSGTALGGYAAGDWARIAAITVLAQLLGHSVFNLVLRSYTPTLVSLAILFTVPLAAVIAALALGQTPPAAAIPALALLLAGIALVITAPARAAPRRVEGAG